jgi:hypothetical protein
MKGKKTEFTKDPFQFVRRLLGKKKSGELQWTKKWANKQIKEMHSNISRHEELRSSEKLLDQISQFKFNSAEPRLHELLIRYTKT